MYQHLKEKLNTDMGDMPIKLYNLEYAVATNMVKPVSGSDPTVDPGRGRRGGRGRGGRGRDRPGRANAIVEQDDGAADGGGG